MLNLTEAVWNLWWTTDAVHVWKDYSLETGARLVAVISDRAIPLRQPIGIVDPKVPLGSIAFSLGLHVDNVVPLYVEATGTSTHEMLIFQHEPVDHPQQFRATGWTRPMVRDSRAPIRAELQVEIDKENLLHVHKCHIEGSVRIAYAEGPNGRAGQTTRYIGNFDLLIG